jgi:predicted ATP-dependent endonuclease of OLD family
MDKLLEGNDDVQTEKNLLKIGGINDPSIIFEDSTRGRRAAEEIGREITKRIQQVWTQEPSLEIKLRVNGKLLYVDFSDSTTVYDTPKSRSPGLLWYLSFYINFIATTNEAKINEYLFLLDEPGLHLHPSGQRDLTRLLEDLAQKNQLLYTTHSPFMINRDYAQRVRVVTKSEKGTDVNSEAYRENWKPLRQSIGLTMGDLFFFSNKGILLEIPSKKSSLFGKANKKG